MLIGIVSDTHGLVRPELLNALRGVDHILHAGDIGKPEVIDKLSALAAVTAIRGNVDRGAWAQAFPETELCELGETTFYLVHSRDWLDLDPRAAQIDVVVSGHSHKPGIDWHDDVLYLNPGSAGPRRFSLPTCCARLRITRARCEPELIDLLSG